jgi:hypothetical protein
MIGGTVLSPMLAAILLSLLSHQPPAPRWTWTPAAESRYQLVATSTARADGMLPFALSQTQTQTVKLRVVEVAASGDATLELTLEFLALKLKPDEKSPEIALASTDPSAPEEFDPATPLRLLVGSTLTVVVSPLGEVREVRGLAALREKITKAFADTPAIKPIAASFADLLTDDQIRRGLESALRLADPPAPSTPDAPAPIVMRGMGTLTRTVARAASGDAETLTVHRTTDFALASPNTDPITQAFAVSLGPSREEAEWTLAPAQGLLRGGSATLTLTTILTPRSKDLGTTPTTRVVKQTLELKPLPAEAKPADAAPKPTSTKEPA